MAGFELKFSPEKEELKKLLLEQLQLLKKQPMETIDDRCKVIQSMLDVYRMMN